MVPQAASHPVVLRVLNDEPLGTSPRRIEARDVPIVCYSSRRLTFKRSALEQLPPEGILLVRVEPRADPPYAVALTRAEFEQVFANVVSSESWARRGIYDLNSFPERARPFLVGDAKPSIGRSGAAPSSRETKGSWGGP